MEFAELPIFGDSSIAYLLGDGAADSGCPGYLGK